MVITELSEQECADILAGARVAHLACSHDGQPYVVPITFAFAQHQIYSFSLPGQKVEWMRRNPKVSLHVGDHGNDGGWKSVVVLGTFEELPDRIGTKRERDHAWSLLSQHANWWEPGALKPLSDAVPAQHLFYRINIDSLSGRRAIAE